MAKERKVWLTIPEGERVEEHPRIVSLLKEGWTIARTSEWRVIPGEFRRYLWVIHLKYLGGRPAMVMARHSRI